MKFRDAVAIIIDIEGGESNDPDDAGGLTKFGISSASYPEVLDPAFNQARAEAIYARDFWHKFLCDKMPSGIDLILFDCAVNQTRTCARLFQAALGVPADGVIGPVTRAAAWNRLQPSVINEFASRRAVAYASRPNVAKFGLGWFRRLHRIASLSHLASSGPLL